MNSQGAQRKSSRWVSVAAVVGGALAVCVLVLWATRTAIVAWAIERVIDDKGLCPCDVELVSLGWSHAVLGVHRTALGNIARVAVDYHATGDFSVAIDRLRIDGAHLALAWRDGKLWPAIASSGGSGALPVARIEVVDSSISLTVGTTVVDAALAGTLVRDPQLVATFDLTLRAPQGMLHGTLKTSGLDDGATESLFTLDDGNLTVGTITAQGLTGTLRAVASAQGQAQLDGKFFIQALTSPSQAWGAGVVSIAHSAHAGLSLAWQSAPLRVALHSVPAPLASGVPFTFEGALDARFLAGFVPGLSVAAGNIAFTSSGTAPALSATLHDWLQTGRMRAELHGQATGVASTDNARIGRLAASLDCALADGALSCTSPQGLKLDGIEVPDTGVRAEGALARMSTLELLTTDGAPLFALTATDGVDKFSVTSTMSLQTSAFAVHGPLSAVITLDDMSRQGQFAMRGKFALERPPGQALFAPELALDGRFALEPNSAALIAAALEQGQIELPKQGWVIRGLSGRYDAGDTQVLKIAVADLRNTHEPQQLAPLRAELTARITANEAVFIAGLHDGTGLVDATVNGRHQRRRGAGEATLAVRPMVFAGAATLGELSPALAARGFQARGAIAVAGSTHWGDGPTRSELSLGLREFALDGPSFKASAVNGDLRLDGLAPLHSASAQHVNGVLELPALKRVPFAMTFSLGADKLLVEQARAELFGGAFETTAAEIDINTGATRLDLRVVDIDLKSAFMVLNLEQLQGSGHIAGRLPLRFESGHLAVDAGHLEATGAGTVQIGASTVTDQLKSYGHDVDLAFRALSDFHYQHLRIDANKALPGTGKALFHLEGDNPAVMNGQPFVFNISLETDFDYLAKLLLELSGTTNSALGWGAGEIIRR